MYIYIYIGEIVDLPGGESNAPDPADTIYIYIYIYTQCTIYYTELYYIYSTLYTLRTILYYAIIYHTILYYNKL